MNEPLNLQSASLTINANAGDDIVLPFQVKATNTTGWTVTFDLSLADSTGNGPAGDPIGQGIVTNTPNTSGGDSSLLVTIPATATAEYANKVLWTTFVRTDVGHRRTLATGRLILK